MLQQQADQKHEMEAKLEKARQEMQSKVGQVEEKLTPRDPVARPWFS